MTSFSSRNTKVFIEEFKGYPIIAIWEINEMGEKKWKKPIISFGVSKAEAIFNNIGEIGEFITAQRKKDE